MMKIKAEELLKIDLNKFKRVILNGVSLSYMTFRVEDGDTLIDILGDSGYGEAALSIIKSSEVKVREWNGNIFIDVVK